MNVNNCKFILTYYCFFLGYNGTTAFSIKYDKIVTIYF